MAFTFKGSGNKGKSRASPRSSDGFSGKKKFSRGSSDRGRSRDGQSSSGGRGPKRFSERRGGSREGSFSGRKPPVRVICTSCGKSCEVPFKPSGDRPVLCSSCFSKKSGPVLSVQEQLEEINKKLDILLERSDHD